VTPKKRKNSKRKKEKIEVNFSTPTEKETPTAETGFPLEPTEGKEIIFNGEPRTLRMCSKSRTTVYSLVALNIFLLRLAINRHL
jgi:hypothetical protein